MDQFPSMDRNPCVLSYNYVDALVFLYFAAYREPLEMSNTAYKTASIKVLGHPKLEC